MGQGRTRRCRSSRACPAAFVALSVHRVFFRPMALFVFQIGPYLRGWGQGCGLRVLGFTAWSQVSLDTESGSGIGVWERGGIGVWEGGGGRRCLGRGGGGGWHKASVSDCLPLAAPIGLSPLLILTLCGDTESGSGIGVWGSMVGSDRVNVPAIDNSSH